MSIKNLLWSSSASFAQRVRSIVSLSFLVVMISFSFLLPRRAFSVMCLNLGMATNFLLIRYLVELAPRLELGKIWVAARRLDQFGITSIYFNSLYGITLLSPLLCKSSPWGETPKGFFLFIALLSTFLLKHLH